MCLLKGEFCKAVIGFEQDVTKMTYQRLLKVDFYCENLKVGIILKTELFLDFPKSQTWEILHISRILSCIYKLIERTHQ